MRFSDTYGVLLSITPGWCEKIASGEKTIEIRRTRPRELKAPFICYIYCTKGYMLYTINGCNKTLLGGMAVIGEFVCDEILPIRVLDNGSIQNWNFYNLEKSCVPYGDMAAYIGKDNTGFGWHITDLKLYPFPVGIEYFTKRPPQSWCYVPLLDSETA